MYDLTLLLSLVFKLVVPENLCGVWGRVPMDATYFVSRQLGLMLLGFLEASGSHSDNVLLLLVLTSDIYILLCA